MKWWELAEKLITAYQDAGSRTTSEKRMLPAEWLQLHGAIVMKTPAAPAAPAASVKKDEPKAEKE